MLTIRYEKRCMLIYSSERTNYYYVDDPKIIDECRKIFAGQNTNNWGLLQELEDIGLRGDIREIECPSINYDISAPLEYYFDYTNKCNLKCVHCYNKDNINSITMSNDIIKKILNDMYKCGIMRVHLAGGEPTTSLSGLNAYMSTAKELGITSSMSTNGVNLSDDIFDIMFENNLFSITVSLEGSNERENSIIRGSGNFYRSVDTIKKMVDIKRKLNVKTIICIKMSYYTNVSYEQLENFVKLGISLGVDVVKFANPERCVFHEKGFYNQVYDDYYNVINYVKLLKNKYGKLIYISDVANPINECGMIGLPNMKGCIGAQELLAINPDGRISPCLMNHYNLGNIYDYDSIRDFWTNSNKLKEYRNLISNYGCSQCEFHEMCRGGCQVRKIVEYGKIQNIDPLCPIKKFEKRLKKNYEDDQKLLKKVKVLHSL